MAYLPSLHPLLTTSMHSVCVATHVDPMTGVAVGMSATVYTSPSRAERMCVHACLQLRLLLTTAQLLLCWMVACTPYVLWTQLIRSTCVTLHDLGACCGCCGSFVYSSSFPLLFPFLCLSCSPSSFIASILLFFSSFPSSSRSSTPSFPLQAVFPCVTELWQSPQLSRLNPKIIQLLLTTIRHLYSNEKIIASKVAEFLAHIAAVAPGAKAPSKPEDPSLSGAGSSSSSATPSFVAMSIGGGAPARRHLSQHPEVDQAALQQLIYMGFSRDHASDALIASGNNLALAMDWILTHTPPGAVSAEVSSFHASLYEKRDFLLLLFLFVCVFSSAIKYSIT